MHSSSKRLQNKLYLHVIDNDLDLIVGNHFVDYYKEKYYVSKQIINSYINQ